MQKLEFLVGSEDYVVDPLRHGDAKACLLARSTWRIDHGVWLKGSGDKVRDI